MTSWPSIVEPGTNDAVARVADVADLRRDRWAPVLDDLEQFLARFVAFPSENDRVAVTLWAAHTHILDELDSTPRLAFLSPEPGSGKTRGLEVLELLVPRPLHVANISAAALFRSVDPEGNGGRRTVLYDEVDTVFGPKAGDHEDIRGLLNAGHRQGATVLRCQIAGKGVNVVESPVYAAVALAGLGDLPDTLLSRSVIIRMRRRAPGERVEAFRPRLHEAQGHAIRDRLAWWAAETTIQDWPDMPDGIEDRSADVWEPLLAVADAIGGTWPDRARVAAVAHVARSQEKTASLGVQLLTDLHQVFTVMNTSDHIGTDELLSALHSLDEAPWADLRGKPLDARGLARRLQQYGVKSRNVRVGERVVKGYSREDLHDPWTRYLPPHLSSQESATSATGATESPSSTKSSTTTSSSHEDQVLDPDLPRWAEQ